MIFYWILQDNKDGGKMVLVIRRMNFILNLQIQMELFIVIQDYYVEELVNDILEELYKEVY